MTLAGDMLKLTVSPRAFHTWLVIFTPGFDVCVSLRCLLASNYFPYVKSLNFPSCFFLICLFSGSPRGKKCFLQVEEKLMSTFKTC